MDRLYKAASAHAAYIHNYHRYKMLYWDKFDYSFLSRNIMYYKRKGRSRTGTWNDIIIAADTETSKGHEVLVTPPEVNHICAWTISFRAYHHNIYTIYGTKPSDMMQAFKRIRDALKGDDIFIYFHNLAYDYVFLRLFIFREFGTPVKELNTKPHYPIMLKFENGIILKDSLCLAQCKLEKWANDLDVNHKKAVGSWDYDIIRDQNWKFSRAELRYIENDTLALCECLDAYCVALNKSIYSIHYTATGIPREEVRERAKKHKGHENFLRQALSYDQFIKFLKLYHGGYSHGNRFFISDLLDDDIMRCFDFASSYPFCLVAFKYPSGRFVPLGHDVKPEYILSAAEDYAFVFRICFKNIRLKDNLLPMPALQASKCQNSINMKTESGRVLHAGYCSLYICEQDLIVLNSLYDWDPETVCTEVEVSPKDYLPRWFTDYVYELYAEKCRRKPMQDKDPVSYALAKSRVNSVYGLCVQKSVRESFIEVTEPGEYKINKQGDTAWYDSGEYRQDFDQDERKEYEKYLKNPSTVLPYQWGAYCTAFAFRNLFELGDCVKKIYDRSGRLMAPPRWVYSDTDSAYSDDWDMDKIRAYNEKCKARLKANGYGPVIVNDKEYWLGVAEPDAEYSEYIVLGPKRYCGRGVKDNELHITVAGVPKDGAKCLKDDISNFHRNFIFHGTETGKKNHFYIFAKDGIYIDDFGNEIGDCIDLQPGDYHLGAVDQFDYILSDDFYMEYFGEENFDIYDK